MLIEILLALQIIEGAVIVALFLKHREHSNAITELADAPKPAQPVVFNDHIVCKQCHSIVARYNPATGLCANCDYEGFVESRNANH